MAQNNALAPRSLNALIDRWESATPLEREVYRQTGMEPGLKRKNILPAYDSKTGITLPQWLYDAALTIVGPAAAAKGIPVSQDEVLNMAANIATSAYAGGAASSLAGKPLRGNISLNAFHGSPHRFKKFDAAHIGSGEGGQMYGHGIYFAENPSVAKTYAYATPAAEMRRKFLEELPENADFDEVMGLIGTGHFSPQQEQVLKALEKDDWLGFDYPAQAISQAYRNLGNYDPSPELIKAIEGSKYLYKVDIPDEWIPKMLDLDAPIEDQPGVTNALHPVAIRWMNDHASNLPPNAKITGGTLREALAAKLGEEGAAKYLQNAGIPGLKYFDAGSRGIGKGTKNFVVFPGNESQVKMLERNDIPFDSPDF